MKKIISTTKAPAPIGPYSQAVLANGMLFVSGQTAINPDTGSIVLGDTFQRQKIEAQIVSITPTEQPTNAPLEPTPTSIPTQVLYLVIRQQ